MKKLFISVLLSLSMIASVIPFQEAVYAMPVSANITDAADSIEAETTIEAEAAIDTETAVDAKAAISELDGDELSAESVGPLDVDLQTVTDTLKGLGWEGPVANGFSGGAGTSSDPYKISSVGELAYLSYLGYVEDTYGKYTKNKYFKQTRTLNLNSSSDSTTNNWVPINNFYGTYDGGGYCINYLYCSKKDSDLAAYNTDYIYSGKNYGLNVGLFGRVYGTVTDLHFVGPHVEMIVTKSSYASYCNVGVLTGYSYRGDISEVYANGGFVLSIKNEEGESSDSGYIGGLIGYSRESTLKDIINAEDDSVTIQGGKYDGGLVGYIENGSATNVTSKGPVKITADVCAVDAGAVIGYGNNTTIDSCKNLGKLNVVSKTVYTHNIGGIVGETYKSVVKFCLNNGAIKSQCEETHNANSPIMGGIVGYCRSDSALRPVTDNVSETDSVIEGGSVAGGIIGKYTGAYNDVPAFQICTNKGIVKAESSAGGVVGETHYGFVMDSCTNEGEVIVDQQNGSSAGIAAFVNSAKGTIKIINCENAGKVIGGSAAGIVATLGWSTDYDSCTGPIVSNCVNGGEVNTGTNSNGSAAGIVNDMIIGKVEGCINSGDVSAADYGFAAGIVHEMGRYYEDYSANENATWLVTQCGNLGEISGYKVGGIVNTLIHGTVSECYNLGQLSVNENGSRQLGGIVGEFGPKSNNAACVVKDCFNYGALDLSGNNSTYVGGIVARICPYTADMNYVSAPMKIENCYQAGQYLIPSGETIDADNVGALVGCVYRDVSAQKNINCTIQNNHYYTTTFDAIKLVNEAVVNQKSNKMDDATAMKTESTFTDTGWDFTSVWKMTLKEYKYELPVFQYMDDNALRILDKYFVASNNGKAVRHLTLQFIDSKSKRGISGVAVSVDSNSYITNESGNIQVYYSGNFKQYVTADSKNYKAYAGMVKKNGSITKIELTPDIKTAMRPGSMDYCYAFYSGNASYSGVNFKVLDLDFSKTASIDFKPSASMHTENDAYGSFPVSVDFNYQDQTVQISWGLAVAESTKKKSYNTTKNLVNDFKKKSQNGSAAKTKNLLEQSGFAKKRMKSGSTAGVSFYNSGYITYKYTNDSFQVIESGGIIGFSGNASVEYRPACTGYLVYGRLGIGVGTSGDLSVSLDQNDMVNWYSTGGLTLSETVSICLGLGVDLANAEAGVEGSLTERFSVSNNPEYKGPAVITLSGTPYAQGQLLMYSKRFDLSEEDWTSLQLYPKTDAQIRESGGIQETNGTTGYEKLARNYAQSKHGDGGKYIADSIAAGRAVSGKAGSVSDLNQSSVYPDGTPQMAWLENGTRIYVWTADAGAGRTDNNRTVIDYLVEKDGVFSDIYRVSGDDTADLTPVLYTKGNQAWLFFLNANEVFADTADLSHVMEHMDLQCAVFDGEYFETPITVRESSKMPMMISPAFDGRNLSVAWVENTANDYYMGSGTNSVYTAKVTDDGSSIAPVLVKENIAKVYDLSSAYQGSDYVIVYSADGDNDLTTLDDSQLYAYKNGNFSQLTNDHKYYTYVEAADDALFYCIDGVIKTASGIDLSTAKATGIANQGDFKLLTGAIGENGSKGRAITFLKADGINNALYVSYFKGEGYQSPVKLLEKENGRITAYDAIYEADGSFSVLYNTKAISEAGGQYTDGTETDMRYTGNVLTNDIVVGSDLTIFSVEDDGTYGIGKKVRCTADVTNNSDVTINHLDATLFTGDKIAVDGLAIAPGCTQAVSVETTATQSMSLKFTTDLISETNLSNNVTDTVAIPNVNYAVASDDIKVTYDGTKYDVAVDVTRNGALSGNPKVSVYLDSLDGKLLGDTTLTDNTTNQYHLEFDDVMTSEDMRFKGASDEKNVIVQITSDASETNYLDNTGAMSIKPAKVTGIKPGFPSGTASSYIEAGKKYVIDMMEGDFLSMNPEVTTSDSDKGFAYNGFIFTSLDDAIISVDKRGEIFAKSAGTAQIEVMTEDGSEQIVVEVNVGSMTTDREIYSFGEDTTVLLSEGEKQTVTLFVSTDNTVDPADITFTASDSDILDIGEKTAVEDTSDGSLVTVEITGKGTGDSNLYAMKNSKKIAAISAVVFGDPLCYAEFDQILMNLKKDESGELQLSSNLESVNWDDFTVSLEDETIASLETSENGKLIVKALKEGETRLHAVHKNTKDVTTADAVCVINVTDPSKEKYVIMFDSNGGSAILEDIAVQTISYKDSPVFPENPVYPAHIFKGWNTKADGTGTYYSKSKPPKAGVDFEELTLYAIWIDGNGLVYVADIPDYTYTGSKITPKVTVYSGGVELTEGVDYKVSYKNNVNARAKNEENAPCAIITGKGNYSGSTTARFTILPISLEDETVTVLDQVYTYKKGKAIKKAPGVFLNGKKVKEKGNYRISYPDTDSNAYSEIGTYTVRVEGNGNFAGSIDAALTIAKKGTSPKFTIQKISSTNYAVDGAKPMVFVNAGSDTITLDPAKGVTYLDTEEQDVSNDTMYNGTTVKNAIDEFVARKYKKGERVVASVIGKKSKSIFFLCFHDYKQIGTGKAEVTAMSVTGETGTFDGIKTASYTISGKNLTDEMLNGFEMSLPYNGAKVIQNAVFIDESGDTPYTLVEGIDYTTAYTKNQKPGTAKVVYTGIGAYQGQLKKKYTISKATLDSTSFAVTLNGLEVLPVGETSSLSIPTVYYETGGATPEIVIKFNGKKLTAGKDYKCTYQNNKAISDTTPAVAMISMKGNYSGSKSYAFNVVPSSLDNVSITVPDVPYKNKAGNYKTAVTLVNKNGKPLKAGVDYDKNFVYEKDGQVLGAKDTVNMGDLIFVTLTGLGNYAGTSKKISYHITKESIKSLAISVQPKSYTGDYITLTMDDFIVTAGKNNPLTAQNVIEIVPGSYEQNLYVGKASVLVRGIGEYGGIKTVSFKIVPMMLPQATQ